MKRISISPLESVVRQFEHWRATRKKRERIPDTLWKLVAPLMNQYGHNEIAIALKVNHGQLRKYVQPLLSHTQQKSTTFVECPLSIATSSVVLEFACRNGSMVKISGLLAVEMQPLISLLIGT
jgi:hypothetical protein